MSLYSKYRPQNFANLVGQETVRQTLLNEIQKNELAHAYLFAGPRGTGKTSTARLIAKAAICERKGVGATAETTTAISGEPCDECDICTAVKEGGLIDVIEIDAASNRGIDEIRDLKEKIKFAPTRARAKIYIIDEIHMLTKEAFNALLKTLEEPPPNVFFILCTTEVHKIPETIISRCQRFDFKRIDVRTIMTRLSYIAQMESIEAEDAAIELIARHVEGGMRDAIGLLEQMAISGKLSADHVRAHLGITGHETVNALLMLLEKNDTTGALNLVNEVHREGYDLSAFVREILECMREQLIQSIQQENGRTAEIIGWIERFEEARDALRNTVIPQLPLEIAVIKITQNIVKNMTPTAGIAAKITPKTQGSAPETTIPPETPEAQKAEETTAATLQQEFTAEQFGAAHAAHWQRVIEHVQPPSLRRSLTDATVKTGTEGTLLLTFSSRFHLEKVNLLENRSKVEKALEHLTGKKIKVNCELDEVAAAKKNNQPEESAPQHTAPKPAASKKKVGGETDFTAKAMEIFGED